MVAKLPRKQRLLLSFTKGTRTQKKTLHIFSGLKGQENKLQSKKSSKKNATWKSRLCLLVCAILSLANYTVMCIPKFITFYSIYYSLSGSFFKIERRRKLASTVAANDHCCMHECTFFHPSHLQLSFSSFLSVIFFLLGLTCENRGALVNKQKKRKDPAFLFFLTSYADLGFLPLLVKCGIWAKNNNVFCTAPHKLATSSCSF